MKHSSDDIEKEKSEIDSSRKVAEDKVVTEPVVESRRDSLTKLNLDHQDKFLTKREKKLRRRMDSGGTDTEKETTIDSVSERIEASDSMSLPKLTEKSKSLPESSNVQNENQSRCRNSSAESEGENQNNSLNETFSDHSDVEARIMALNEQLQNRIKISAQLKKEQKLKRREKLMSQEKMLLKQIEVYDNLINKNQVDITKDKTDQSETFSKPKIKSPRSSLGERSLSGEVPYGQEKPKPPLASQVSEGTLSVASIQSESIESEDKNLDSIQSGSEMPTYTNASENFEKESDSSNNNSSSTILASPIKGLSPAPVEIEKPSELLISEVIEEALESFADANEEDKSCADENQDRSSISKEEEKSESKSLDGSQRSYVESSHESSVISKEAENNDMSVPRAESIERHDLENEQSKSLSKRDEDSEDKESSSIEEAFDDIESSRISEKKSSLISAKSIDLSDIEVRDELSLNKDEKCSMSEESESKEALDDGHEEYPEEKTESEKEDESSNNKFDDKESKTDFENEHESKNKEEFSRSDSVKDKSLEGENVVSEAYEIDDDEFPAVTEDDTSKSERISSKVDEINVANEKPIEQIKDTESAIKDQLEERVEIVTAMLLKDLLNESTSHLVSLLEKEPVKKVED